MDADEFFGWEFEGKGFEVIEGEDGVCFAAEVDLGIVFHAFAEEDVGEIDLDDTVFGLDEDEAVVAGVVDIYGRGEVVLDFADGGQEAFEAEGAVEVAEHVHVGLFFILFGFIGDTDDDGEVAGFFEAEHDFVVEEADVPEDDFGAGLGDELEHFGGRVAFSGKIEARGFGDILFE
jgi:hypothetical protein